MTKEELKTATAQELIEQRDYCGVDGYYNDYLQDVSEEMLNRFNRLAELEKENERLTVQYETLKLHDEEEISMLKAQIYKMRCCDNCCHCNGGVTDEAGNSICDNCDDDMSEWEY